MRSRLWLLFMLLPALCSARVGTIRLDTSAVNLTSTYTLIALPTFTAIDTIYISNRSATEISVSCDASIAVAPDSATKARIVVNASESWALPDKTGFGKYCYWKSNGSTISTGVIVITAIGR